jgi:hypothetical protein
MPKKERREELTWGDRAVTALMTGICGFATMLLIWFVVMSRGGRYGQDTSLPFSWNWVGAGVAAVIGFVIGPERAMDSFEWIWWIVGLQFWRGVPSPRDRRQRRF